MSQKKRNAVEWAMHYRQIIILVVSLSGGIGNIQSSGDA